MGTSGNKARKKSGLLSTFTHKCAHEIPTLAKSVEWPGFLFFRSAFGKLIPSWKGQVKHTQCEDHVQWAASVSTLVCLQTLHTAHHHVIEIMPIDRDLKTTAQFSSKFN